MIFTERFAITEWNEEKINEIKVFWIGRGMIFEQASKDVLTGRRGSMMGNMLAYDMSKLITKVTIIKENHSEVICELEVNTNMQYITSWNKEFWKLELDTFKSVVNKRGALKEEWDDLMKRSKKENIKWTIKFAFAVVVFCVLVEVVWK